MFPLAYTVGMSCIQGLRLTPHENTCFHFLLCLPSSLSISWGPLLAWPHHKFVTIFTPCKKGSITEQYSIYKFILLKRLTTEGEEKSYNNFILWETVGQNSRDNFHICYASLVFLFTSNLLIIFPGLENQDVVLRESYSVLSSSN